MQPLIYVVSPTHCTGHVHDIAVSLLINPTLTNLQRFDNAYWEDESGEILALSSIA